MIPPTTDRTFRRPLLLFVLLAGLGCKSNDDGCLVGSVSCAAEKDCPAGTRCRGPDNTCVKLFCLADGETCDDSDTCASKDCRPVTKGADQRVCKSNDGSYFSACARNGDCKGGLVCRRDSDCANGVCDDAGTEHDRCCQDDECQQGLTCVQTATLIDNRQCLRR